MLNLKCKLRIGLETLAIVAIALFPHLAFATGPQVLTLQGRLVRPDSTPVEASTVDFTLQVRSPGTENCILFEETHTLNMLGSDGVFSIRLGTGSRSGSNFKDTSTLAQVFNNKGSLISSLTCASGSTYAPTANDARKLRITFDEGGGAQTLAQDQVISAVPYALYADTLQGKTPSNFVQTISTLEATPGTTQTRFDRVFDTDYTVLDALLNGTSTLYAKATPTSAVDYNGQRIINVADPTGAQDAATKNYTDTKIGSKAIDLVGIGSGTGDGKVLSWDATNNKWVASTPSTTDATKLPLAGGTMAGDINMGGYNILAAGNVQLGLQKTLLLGRYTTAEETTLVGTLLASDAGRMWYNTTTGKQRYWNGTTATNVSSADIGTAAGQVMGADAVPHCTSSQKLEMSLGPTFAWSCVTDNSQWITNGSDIGYTAGKVGIGTTAPDASLEIVGSSTTNAKLHVQGGAPSTASTEYAVGSFNDLNGSGVQIGYQSDAAGTAVAEGRLRTMGSVPLALGTTTYPRAIYVLNTNGNVGVGTTAPAYKFDVSGAVNATALKINGVDVATGAQATQWTTTASDIYYNTGKVGIGTSAPAYALDVQAATAKINVQSTTVGNTALFRAMNGTFPSIFGIENSVAGTTFTDSTSLATIFGSTSATNMQFATNNAVRATIVGTTGYVGIGTTAPTTALHVIGDIKGSANISGSNIAGTQADFTRSENSGYTATSASAPNSSLSLWNNFNTDANVAGQQFVVRNTATTIQTAFFGAVSENGGTTYAPSLVWGNRTASSGAYQERMRLTSSGRVGIATTAPAYTLDVNGTINATALKIGGVDVSGGSSQWTTASSDIYYTTGKVGIGTTAPQSTLHVAQSEGTLPATAIGDTLILQNNAAGTTTDVNLDFVSMTGKSAMINFGLSSSKSRGNIIYYHSNDSMRFGTAAATRVTIDSSGNVGIGTTAPAQPLHVTGAARVDGNLYFGAGPTAYISSSGLVRAGAGAFGGPTFSFNNDNDTGMYNPTTNEIGFSTAGAERVRVDATGKVGIGTTAPGEVLEVNGNVKATAFISTSDRRLKTNIRPIEGLELIRRLNGVRYNWKSNGKADFGVIAQDVESVIPEAVVTDANTGFKAVKYPNLVSPLIEATKELDNMCRDTSRRTDMLEAFSQTHARELASVREENQKLKAEVESLKKQNESFEARLKRLEDMSTRGQ